MCCPSQGVPLRLPTCPWASCRPLRREVPDVTNTTAIALPELNWASRLGASSPRVISLPGTGLPAACRGTGPSTVVVHAVPRVRAKAAFVASAQQRDAVATLLGQTNIHNYMTGATAVGEGASGPPRDRAPVLPDRPELPSRPRTRTQ